MNAPWSRRRWLCAAGGAAATMATTGLHAQTPYPARPIRLIVGYPAGGFTDIVMRAAAVEAEKKLGQTVIIENRPGAAGVTSFLAIKNAAPDGYVIGAVNTAVWRQPVLEDVAYDPIKDFTYIINMVDNVFAVTVAADAPFRTWADLLTWGRANAQQVSYAVPPGLGQSAHIFMEEVAARDKVAWQAVPYKGSAESVTALLGKQVTFSVDTVIGTNAIVQGGKARYLAIASNHRLKSHADVPTMRDLGYNVAIDSPTGLGGPAGLPAHVVKTLHDAFKFALEQPAVIALLERSDQLPRYMATDDYRRWVAQSAVEQRDLLTRYGFAKKR
ncbi:tripartite tricarboxylate transporter substrate binding protein [Variovorax sp. KK3]